MSSNQKIWIESLSGIGSIQLVELFQSINNVAEMEHLIINTLQIAIAFITIYKLNKNKEK